VNIVNPGYIAHPGRDWEFSWKTVPEELQPLAFGPKRKSPELNRRHEVEGAKIARRILEELNYDRDKTEEIIAIIDGHDSRKEARSLNDQIVKDADKLYRCSKAGLRIDCRRFALTPKEAIEAVNSHLDTWFFTHSAKEMARKEIENRLQESEEAP
jgi:HD superfamily phosphodiesterase